MDERRGTDRRTLLRAGAVAWTAPVVVAVAAAPAHAASGSGAAAAVTLGPLVRTPQPNAPTQIQLVNVASTITNTGAEATAALMVVVDLVATSDRFGFGIASITEPLGFQLVRTVRSADFDDVSWIFLAEAQLAPDAIVQFTPQIDVGYNNEPGRVTITAQPGGGGTAGSASGDLI